MTQAQNAFRQGNRDEGYRLYQQIAESSFASSHYPAVRDALKERKESRSR
jgi:hypothetical protein